MIRAFSRGWLRCWLVLCALCACLWSAPAQADRMGFEAALRSGYGLPFGDISQTGGELSNRIDGQVPLWLDLGFRAGPYLFVGLFGHYGFGFVANEEPQDYCSVLNNPGESTCATRLLRGGVQAHLHLLPYKTLDPWIGIGIGYEEFFSRKGQLETTLSGFEFLNLQFGLDLKSAGNWYIGPWVSFSLARFSKSSSSGEALCADEEMCVPMASGPISNDAVHQWLLIGVRIAYEPR